MPENPHRYRLSSPSNIQEWNSYHAIRRRVLWEARGLGDEYDPDRPDERATNHYPLLLFVGEEAVGVIRVDLDPETSQAIFRRVAIREDRQRQGHGIALMQRAEEFAVARGCSKFTANVALDAVAFYRKIGYRLDEESAGSDPRSPRMTKTRL